MACSSALMAGSTGQRGYVGTLEASPDWRHTRNGSWEKQRERSAVGGKELGGGGDLG